MLIGLAIFVVGLMIRSIGIGWGLPNDIRKQSLHPDEPIVWMYSQQIEPAKGKFTPGFYNYGTLYLTFLRVSTDMATAYGAGPKADGSDLDQAIGRYILVGRWLSAIAGALIPWVVFAWMRRFVGLIPALSGAFAAMIAPGLLVHSRFQTVDVLATLFFTLSLYWAMRLAVPEGEEPLAQRDLTRFAVAAGVWAGLSAGTKYSGILALIAVPVVLILQQRASRVTWKQVGVAGGLSLVAAIAIFVVTTPGVLLQSEIFWRDFKYEMAHTSTGHGLVFAGTGSGFVVHLLNLARGYGFLLLILSLAGLGLAFRNRNTGLIAASAVALAVYVLIGRADVKFLRYTFPLIPVLALGFGVVVHALLARAKESTPAKGLVALCFLAVGGIFGGGINDAAKLTGWMALEDSRDSAGRWLKAQSGPDDVAAVVADPWFYTASLYPEVALPRSVPFNRREVFRLQATNPAVSRYVPANPDERIDWDVRVLDSEPKWVVFSSFEADDISRVAADAVARKDFEGQAAAYEAFIKRLQAEYEVARIDGADGPAIHDLMYVRPRVWIWKRKTDSTPTSTGSSTN